MTYQAVITNGAVCVIAFLAYVPGYWSPAFVSILIIFSTGILVDSILAVFYAGRVLYPRT